VSKPDTASATQRTMDSRVPCAARTIAAMTPTLIGAGHSGLGGRSTRTGAAVAVLLLAGALFVGCSESQGGMTTANPDASDSSSDDSLDLLEIDDERIDLPRTELVTCQEDARHNYLFAWMGSNLLVPRQPIDEEERSSNVQVAFEADPPAASTMAMQQYFRGELVKFQWSNSGAGQQPATLRRLGERRYIFTGTVTETNTVSASHYVRIEFHC
jgi:hypothetical protein